MQQANYVLFISLCFIALGYLLKKFDFVTEQDGKVISKFLMHTTVPAMILSSTIRIDLEPRLFLIPLLAIAIEGLMLLVAWFAFSEMPNQLRGILTMGASGLNLGLFAFPIVEGIWGKEALVYAIMYDIGNLVIVFGAIYPIGVYFTSKGESKIHVKAILQKVIKLPPLQGMVIGLTCNALSFHPPIVVDFLDILAKANKPLVLLLMGIYLNFKLEKEQISAVAKVLGVRYFVGLSLVAAYYFGFSDGNLFWHIMIVCAILPAGLTLLPFSDELNYDSKIAGAIVNISLLISFALLWALVIGLKLA